MARKGLTIPVVIILLLFLVTPASLLVYRAQNPSVQNVTSDLADEAGLSGNNNVDTEKPLNESISTPGKENRPKDIVVSTLWDPGSPRAEQSVDFYVLNGRRFDEVRWELGDGSVATGDEISHTYQEPGSYTINVTVETEDAIGWKSNQIEVREMGEKPIPEMDFQPDKITAGDKIDLSAGRSSHPAGRIVNYQWNIGGVRKDGKEVQHTFGSEGPKTVVLTVTGSKGLNSTRVEEIEVGPPNELPAPRLDWDTSNPKVGENITFDASESADSDGEIVEYWWKFEQESYYNGSEKEWKVFESPGVRNVSLKVVDDVGGETWIEEIINVTVNQPPDVRIDYSPSPPVPDQRVNFEAVAVDKDGSITKYQWDFNQDGEYEVEGPEVDRYFVESGKKEVTLKVTDDGGLSKKTTIEINVDPSDSARSNNEPPVASFSYDAQVPREGEELTFDASNSEDSDGQIESYRWDFDQDGQHERTGSRVTESIDDFGSVNVGLRVADDDGSADRISKELEIVRNECEKMHVSGKLQDKADIIFVGRNYESDSKMKSDFDRIIDFDRNHADFRGLFDVYPMNVSRDKFNLWRIDAGVGNIADHGEGLVSDTTEYFDTCGFADYKVLLSKDGFDYLAFAHPSANRMFIGNVANRVENDDGAKALLHEWGHGFAGLKDEYHTENGRDASGKPNCAPTREKAEEWWGNLAETHPEVGYEQGCAYQADNWEPHPGGTIMGDGGLWHYGPVNDRRLLEELDKYQ